MEIFITGGTGNIGQYVTLELLNRGHSVRLLTRTPERIPAFLNMENVKVIKGNILDFNILEEAVKGCDAAIHIALGWGNDPVEMLTNDTRVTAFLLDACERAGVKNFIYTSSTAATGNLRNGMDETALRIPTDLYGSTKAASEVYVLGFRQYYSKQGGYGERVKMRRNIIRPGYTYSNPAVEGGASQSDDRFKKIAQAIVNNENLTFPINDGTQFLSSRQIAKVYADLCESDLNEEIFFALGKNSVSWYEIALLAKKLYPQSKSVITAEGEKSEPWLYCVDKIERIFGLSFDSMEDIAEHVKWNLERAIEECQGKTPYNTKHEFC